MAGFITSGLDDYPGDWICIVDFFGRYNDEANTNISAWYSPSKQITRFLGDWWDAPDQKSTNLPNEDRVFKWAFQHTVWGKRQVAEQKKKKLHEQKMEAILKDQRDNGVGWGKVTLTLPDGTIRNYDHPAGLCKNTMDLLRQVGYNLTLLPNGTKITKLKYSVVPYDDVQKWHERPRK